MREQVFIREVGLRDGLQMVRAFVPTATKLAWMDAERRAGVREMEVTSFVPASVVPQFVDAAEIVAHALTVKGLTPSVLVPNLRGAERAIKAGAPVIAFVMSVSRTHNHSNVRRTREASLDEFNAIAARLGDIESARRPRLIGGLATSFGCSFEGRVDPAEVLRLAETLASAGADEIMLADTVGYGDPGSVRALFREAAGVVGGRPLLAHFHDTLGVGLANVVAALDAGVRRFDASLAGLGGCPFAPGATGNIVTEDLGYMLEAMGFETGLDLDGLLEARRFAAGALPDEVREGALHRAGVPKTMRAAA